MRTHHNPKLIFYLCSNTVITCDTYNWLDLKLENYRQNYTIVQSDAMYNKNKIVKINKYVVVYSKF